LAWFVTPVTMNVHLDDTDRRAIVVREAVTRLLATGPIPGATLPAATLSQA
jgi:hypothetical protein